MKTYPVIACRRGEHGTEALLGAPGRLADGGGVLLRLGRKAVLAGACCLLGGCVQSTVTRVREDGAKEVIVTKGLSDRAATTGLLIGDRLLDRYLGADVETRSSK